MCATNFNFAASSLTIRNRQIHKIYNRMVFWHDVGFLQRVHPEGFECMTVESGAENIMLNILFEMQLCGIESALDKVHGELSTQMGQFCVC